MPLAFPDAVANEKKFWEPLANPDNASSKLRRKLFQGHTISAETGVELGGTNGLVGAATRLMEEWGFEFEVTVNEENGKKQHRLLNPQHVPTTHVKKPVTGIRRERKKGDENGNGEERTPRGWSPVHREIREKLIAGDEISIGETMAMGASSAFLRKEVSRMVGQGFKIKSVGHGVDRTYVVTQQPKKADAASTNGNGKPKSKGKAIEKMPSKSMARNGNAADMMFGELSTPIPNLGGRVRVIGMMLDEEDDTVKLAVKDDTGTWMARIEGYVEADS